MILRASFTAWNAIACPDERMPTKETRELTDWRARYLGNGTDVTAYLREGK